MLRLDDWLDIAESAKKAGTLYLLRTGGEPLLWGNFYELYEKLVKMGFLVSINTNGSLIDEKAVEFFRKFPPRQINITLYGANNQTYRELCGVSNVFDRVDRAITNLKNAGICVKLNCSLTPSNAKDLDFIVSYAKEKNINLSASSYMFPPIRRKDSRKVSDFERFTPEEAAKYRLLIYKKQNGEEAYKELLKSIKDGNVSPLGLDESCIDPVDGEIRCRAGKAAYWITWDGFMLPCGLITDIKTDIVKDGFERSWGNIVTACDKARLSGICEKCGNIKLCRPCAAIALAETGSIKGVPEYLCLMSREMTRIAKSELL